MCHSVFLWTNLSTWDVICNIYIGDSLNPIDTLCRLQGWIQARAPLKLEKMWFFWRKIVIFHTKYPNNFRAFLSLLTVTQLALSSKCCVLCLVRNQQIPIFLVVWFDFRSTWVHPRLSVGFVLLDLYCICMFCRSLFVLLYFFFWPLCCLFFFDIRILITTLVSSNSSWPKIKSTIFHTWSNQFNY